MNRRHLSREQKRVLIAESLRADPGLSNREHARRTGAHKNTVQVVREELEESGQIAHFDKRQDPRTGNLSQPASQPPRPEPEPSPEPVGEEDTPAPSWEPAGSLHPADLAALKMGKIPKMSTNPRMNLSRVREGSQNVQHGQNGNNIPRALPKMGKFPKMGHRPPSRRLTRPPSWEPAGHPHPLQAP